MKNEEEFQRQEEGASPQWIVTFADLMNLLLCFFILLLSFSETDRAKYKQVAGSMKEAFGVVKESGKTASPEGGSIVGRELDRPIQTERNQSGDRVVKNFDESVVAEKTRDLSRYVETESKGNKFIIRLQGEPTFESGSAVIRPEMIPVLRKVGEVLKYAKGDVIVAGHTDNVPIHSSIYPSNLELSVSRAVSVSQFMISNNYIQPGRLSTMGFGEYRPIASNDTSEGRARNRRVEIIVTDLFS